MEWITNQVLSPLVDFVTQVSTFMWDVASSPVGVTIGVGGVVAVVTTIIVNP